MTPKLSMAELLAKARAAKKQQEQAPLVDEVSEALPDYGQQAVQPSANSSHTVVMAMARQSSKKEGASSAIAGLRARLALAATIESARVTEAAQAEGTLQPDEEIVCSLELVDTSKQAQEETASEQGAVAVGMHGEAITYNTEQQEFIHLISSGASCVLVGAAGTGKTTCSQGGTKALIAAGLVPTLQADGHKYLVSGSPGILIISYTRRAVNNIRKVQSEDLKNNCITSHKLLEYQPEYYEIEDPETGTSKKTMRFEPNRCATNTLPTSIHTIIVEEASMLSVELFSELTSALDHKMQWVFIGDIQQLPPVFGSAILGFKMLELPVVELTKVYRQALESPIIRLAHRILSGKPIPVEEYTSWKEEGEHGALTIHPWKKKLSAEDAARTLAAFFKAGIDTGNYNPEEDMILIPYNKACGTVEVNAHIANHLARKKEVLTYEVMAGFNKHYFSVGDRVLYDREDAEIIEIYPNQAYSGGRVQPPSKTLDYWGHNPNLATESANASSSYDPGADIDFLLDSVASSEDRVTQSSHNIVVRLHDTASEVTVSKAAEVNNLLHSYALTVHKAQGSEWRKVFFCLHQTHATMLQRELLYTGVTRAREELYVICEPESFTKGIISQKIKGNTLTEKAEFFKGKLESKKGVS